MATLLGRIRSRIQRETKLLELNMRRAFHQGEVVEDYGWVRLPYSGDGDLQEVFYHINCHRWHADEKDALAGYLCLGDTVADVGANLGFMTAIFHELVGPEGHVVAFEPSPRAFHKLERTIAINEFQNVEAINAGCGSDESTATLYAISGSSGNNTLVPEDGDGELAEEVRLVRFDDVFRDRHVDFVKIDTEGYESVVLEGAVETLRRDRPGLYIELSQEYEASSRKAIGLLRDLGYTFRPDPDLDRAHNGDNFLAIHPERPGTTRRR